MVMLCCYFVLCHYLSCRSSYGHCSTVVQEKFNLQFSLNIISLYIYIYIYTKLLKKISVDFGITYQLLPCGVV